MKKIAVIHYMPLEFYPPVTNFLDEFSTSSQKRVRVFSSENNKGRTVYQNSYLEKIYRSSFPSTKESSVIRMFKYFLFNSICFLNLLLFQPDKIIYFESYSVWPVYWYLRLFGKKTKLFIHYHEYTSSKQYLNGMRLVKIYHTYENKFLYKKAQWISHTNQQRIHLFLKDLPAIDPMKMKVLQNYPPKSWSMKSDRITKSRTKISRTVYIGSLSLSDTFIKEYCEWVMSQNGMLTFDIYSFNMHSETLSYLEGLQSQYIRFYREGVEYNNIPEILSNYDIGVILYKGTTENYIYNAPNKLFEYLACGLKVIYSIKMLGIKPYDSEQVMPLDFETLGSATLLNFSTFENKNIASNQFTAENALKPLINELDS